MVKLPNTWPHQATLSSLTLLVVKQQTIGLCLMSQLSLLQFLVLSILAVATENNGPLKTNSRILRAVLLCEATIQKPTNSTITQWYCTNPWSSNNNHNKNKIVYGCPYYYCYVKMIVSHIATVATTISTNKSTCWNLHPHEARGAAQLPPAHSVPQTRCPGPGS